jgi:NDP-sugar pyrophosphorylase family protein
LIAKTNAPSVAPIGLEAVVLAGGKGTRLRSVVSDRPKPMAPVGGKPFLEWLIRDLRKQGVERLILSTGHMSASIESYFGSGEAFGLEIVYSREDAPLGTGGAVKLALPKLQGQRFFALNGDSYCDFSLSALLHAHVEKAASATLWLVSVDDSQRFGAVSLNGNREITEFWEKSAVGRSGLINAGIYLLERYLIDRMPADTALSLERDLFPGLIGKGIMGIVGSGPFIDIGTPESYGKAELFINQRGK